MKPANPGVVHVIGIPRQPGAPARARDSDAESWEALTVAPPRGLYDALLEQLPHARWRPAWLDVRVEHAFPEPTAQLLDSAAPLDRHLTLGVLQVLTAVILRGARVQNDNPGLTPDGH